MVDEVLQRDLNRIAVMGAVTDDSDLEIFQVRGNPITKRLLVDNDALPENTDGTYIGDVKFGESLPTGTNYIGQVGITGSPIIIGNVGVLSGSSRLGNVAIERGVGGFMSKITITQAGTTRELAITRDNNDRVISISETIS